GRRRYGRAGHRGVPDDQHERAVRGRAGRDRGGREREADVRDGRPDDRRDGRRGGQYAASPVRRRAGGHGLAAGLPAFGGDPDGHYRGRGGAGPRRGDRAAGGGL